MIYHREFGHYPEHVVQYFHECMPEGYTQRRITRFTLMSGNDVIGEEGTMTTMHTIKLEEGLVNGKPGWYCDNKVTLEANFKEGSVLLKNDALTMLQPSSVEKAIPFENGLKNYVQFVSISFCLLWATSYGYDIQPSFFNCDR